jgi:hypothetical protein
VSLAYPCAHPELGNFIIIIIIDYSLYFVILDAKPRSDLLVSGSGYQKTPGDFLSWLSEHFNGTFFYFGWSAASSQPADGKDSEMRSRQWDPVSIKRSRDQGA